MTLGSQLVVSIVSRSPSMYTSFSWSSRLTAGSRKNGRSRTETFILSRSAGPCGASRRVNGEIRPSAFAGSVGDNACFGILQKVHEQIAQGGVHRGFFADLRLAQRSNRGVEVGTPWTSMPLSEFLSRGAQW